MSTFFVNGQEVGFADGSESLLTFLREGLNLTGTKNGCSEGACGTCTVVVDGKAVRACIPPISKLVGKHVTTIEGLTERERAVYAYAFSKTGAVQCGFCTPGMVMSGKALLLQTPDPTSEQVRQALRGNICRCTGYVKIEEAILLAGRMFREGEAVPEPRLTGRLGEDFFRVDAAEKTLGTGLYTDDITLDGMVYAKVLRSKYPRARIVDIDYSLAALHPDYIQVITAEDVPGNIK